MAYQFKCHNCGEASDYRIRQGETFLMFDMAPFKANAKRQSRTYNCANCREENTIENDENEWHMIDLETP